MSDLQPEVTTLIGRLAHRLVKDGFLSPEQAKEAFEQFLKTRESLVTYLVEKKLVSGCNLAMAVAEEFSMSLVDIDAINLNPETVKRIDEKLLKKHKVLPIFERGNCLFIAISDPTHLSALDEIKLHTKMDTEAVVVEADKLVKVIVDEVADKLSITPVAEHTFKKRQHIATDRQEGRWTELTQMATNKKDKGTHGWAIVTLANLARSWRKQPETLSLLKQIATDKQEDEKVRSFAIRALAKNFQEQPETFPLLRQFATDKQEDEKVRSFAIGGLATYFQEQPETLSLLRQIATDKQESNEVRCFAIEALAEATRDIIVATLLRQLATDKQENGSVRVHAIWTLTVNFRKHSETLPLLKQLMGDTQESDYVRKAVVRGLAKNYYEEVQQKLLVDDLEWWSVQGERWWLSPDSVIDDARIQQAADKFKLPAEIIRQHYESIAKDIPLKLTFKRN